MEAAKDLPQPGRAASDRGSVLVEFALVLPLLALIVLGLLEFGMAWSDGNVVEKAAAAGARIGSSRVQAPETDQDIIESVASAFSATKQVELERIIVYRATSADGKVPASCKAVTPSNSGAGQSGLCNVYTKWQAENATGFRIDTTGCPGAWDASWCPSTRNYDRDPTETFGPPDYIGVYVEATYEPLTGMLPGEVTIERSAVFMIEPTSRSSED